MKYLAFLFILTISTAHAEVNKCVDSKGKINFTDKPCLHGQTASTVKIKPLNTMDSSQDKQAINQLKQQQRRRTTYLTYPTNQKDSITIGNEQRMNRMKSALPNGLGTGRGCYLESNQYYCY